MPVVKATSFTLVDSTAAAEGVTGFNIKFGTVSGGPYPQVCSLSAADVTAEEAAGSITDQLANLIPPANLVPGTTYFAIATAVNAAGESGPSPEFKFTVAKLPNAPTAISIS